MRLRGERFEGAPYLGAGDEVAAKFWANPSCDAILSLLPPLVGHTFVGDPKAELKVVVHPDGKVGPPPEPPFDPFPFLGLGERPVEFEHDLAGDLPVAVFRFYGEWGNLLFEETVFVDGQELFVNLRMGDGRNVNLKLLPWPSEIPEGEFEAALGSIKRRWERTFEGAMELEIPDPLVGRACRVAIARALSACVGPHPKYGIGRYAERRHDSFPPATISLVLCLLEWGLFDEAKRRLGYYLDRFVNPDGSFDYYGPAISEYGQMLWLAAKVWEFTGDDGWLGECLPSLERIGRHLLRWPERDEAGLLVGPAEADTFERHRMAFFSGNLWAARGLLDFARALRHLKPGAEDEFEAPARRLLEATVEAARRSVDETTTPPFVPPAPGVRPFEKMTQDVFSSYTNYRYWPEMLSPGLLPPDLCDHILDYRASHGGELLGMTRFMGWLDDWPLFHVAAGLLVRGRAEKFLLTLYAHLLHHQARGTLTAYEQASIEADPHRRPVAEFCLPSQLAVPIMAKWAVAFDDPSSGALRLLPAVPPRWLREGIAARGLPTRWGRVDLEAHVDERGRLQVGLKFREPPRGRALIELCQPKSGSTTQSGRSFA